MASPQKREQEPPIGSRKRKKVEFAIDRNELDDIPDDLEVATEKNVPRVDKGAHGEDRQEKLTLVDEALALHIASHLNNLMLLSVRLISIQNQQGEMLGEDIDSVSIKSKSGSFDGNDSRMDDLKDVDPSDFGTPQIYPTEYENGPSKGPPEEARDAEWAFVVSPNEQQIPSQNLLSHEDSEKEDEKSEASVSWPAEQLTPSEAVLSPESTREQDKKTGFFNLFRRFTRRDSTPKSSVAHTQAQGGSRDTPPDSGLTRRLRKVVPGLPRTEETWRGVTRKISGYFT
ncbi:hypothetical protein DL768_004946 [Monosporascus sp. mg162]|nr:hypothetical protein DL768_004946 [Monosporascus sp. mg162]